jgi:Tfp pilus assembly protein PilN
MSPDINLATKTVAKIRQKQRLKHLADLGIIWVSLFLAVTLIIISTLSLVINKQNQEIENKIKTTKGKIESLSKVEAQQVYLTSKLASFAGLLKTHELHQSVAETIFALIPSGTTLKGFEVKEDGAINLSGSSPNWQLFSRLLVNLQQTETKPLQIKGVKVNKVGFDAQGIVNFDLELTIGV